MMISIHQYSDDNVDLDRAVRMALVHDLAEAIVGDITPPEYYQTLPLCLMMRS
jgi:5'-deoxynucleotidase YfbR-like HD superfamily hydrolase